MSEVEARARMGRLAFLRVAELRRKVLGRTSKASTLWIGLILLGEILVFTFICPQGTFLTPGNFRGVAIDTSEILLLAGGQTVVLIGAGIDLSIGSLVIFCSVISAELLGKFSGPASSGYPAYVVGLAVAVPASLAAGSAWGFINGWVTVNWRVPPFIVTMGTLWMALGLAQVISGGINVATVPPQIQEGFIGGGLFGFIPWPIVLAGVGIGALWLLLSRTRFGMRTYALGANVEALRRAGVNVKRHTILLYMIMGLICGVVGMMDMGLYSTASLSSHQLDNLNAIAAVCIGGTSLFGGRGHIGGTIIGAFIPAILRNGFIILGITPFWQNVVVGIFLIVAVFFDQVRRSGMRSVLPMLIGRVTEIAPK